ncbi:MAG: transglutaminase domain-containing protein [Firmicutes bacterium]|nr:transglutaminase domain-containing protein [Bacillota bacterium]
MHKDRNNHLYTFIALLLVTALLLTGCGSASRTFYFSGSDDPLGLREIQKMVYEETLSASKDQPDDESSEENSADPEMTEAEDIADSSQPEGSEQEEETSEPEESTPLYDEEAMERYYALASGILDEVGWDLEAAYHWCTEIEYFNATPDDPNLGICWFADFGFDQKLGNCYVYAATFTVMARLLGYEARQVDGHILDFEYLHHSWVEIVIDDETYVCDPEFEWQKGMNGYMKKYGEEGYWELNMELISYMDDLPGEGSIEAIVERGWPAEPPYDEVVDYIEYLQYLEQQEQGDDWEDPNTGCVDDDVPVQ